MISKKFAQKVVANHAKGLVTRTKNGNEYYAELLQLGNWITVNVRDCAVVVRRIDKDDFDYAPIVAWYSIGSGWNICG